MSAIDKSILDRFRKGGPDFQCLGHAEMRALFGACTDMREKVRDEALGALLYPEVPDLPGYYIRLAAYLAGARFRIEEIPVELLQVFFELIGSAGRFPKDPLLSEFCQTCIAKAPPRLWDWLFEKRFAAEPFLKGLVRRVGRSGRLSGMPYPDPRQGRRAPPDSHENRRRRAGEPALPWRTGLHAMLPVSRESRSRHVGKLDSHRAQSRRTVHRLRGEQSGPADGGAEGPGARWRILKRILSEKSSPLLSSCLEITLADLKPLFTNPRKGRRLSRGISTLTPRLPAVVRYSGSTKGAWRKIARHLAAPAYSRGTVDRLKEQPEHGVLSSAGTDIPANTRAGRVVPSRDNASLANLPPSVPSSFADIYREGEGKRKLLFWECLAREQAGELTEIARLGEEVSARTGRVVLSWHNASLAAAGGWGFEGFAGRFPSEEAYRDFMYSVFETAGEIRIKFKTAPGPRGSSAPAPGGSWTKAFERMIVSKPAEPCAREGVGTASAHPSPEAERRRTPSMSAAVTSLSAMRVRRIFAPKAAHALENLRALKDFDKSFEAVRTLANHRTHISGDIIRLPNNTTNSASADDFSNRVHTVPPVSVTITRTEAGGPKRQDDHARSFGPEYALRAAGHTAGNYHTSTGELPSATSTISTELAWLEGVRAASTLLSPEEIAEIAAAAKSEWSGAVSPHQRVSLEEALAWADHDGKSWSAGLALLLALAIRGQEALDSGLVSSFVLPWIDKFFISSRRRADQDYLEALFRLVGSVIDNPLILFWEDTSHAERPSFGLALEDLCARGLPFRGIGIFDPGGSKRSEAIEIIAREFPQSLLFALRPIGDSHFAGSLRRVFEQPDFHFFSNYDSSWKDNLVFIYSGTRVFPLLSVQTEMEATAPWVSDGRRRYPFGAWFRRKLRREMAGGRLSKRVATGRSEPRDLPWEAYATWANLL